MSEGTLMAQVRNVKKDARAYKENNKSGGGVGSSYDNNNDDDPSLGDELVNDIFGNFFLDLFSLPFVILVDGHREQLSRRKEEPWRVGADVKGFLGYQLNRELLMMRPEAEIHWGLFTTGARFSRLSDKTGTLRTIDWQVLQFNLVNSKSVKFRFGMGMSRELFAEQTHFEKTLTLSGYALGRTLTPSIEYRWSADGTPRQELNATVGKEVQNEGRLKLAIVGGYSYQKWYSIPYHFALLGLKMNID